MISTTLQMPSREYMLGYLTGMCKTIGLSPVIMEEINNWEKQSLYKLYSKIVKEF